MSTAPDWQDCERRVIASRGWMVDDDGVVRRQTGVGLTPVPHGEVLDALESELAPKLPVPPSTLTPSQRAFLAARGLSIDTCTRVVTSKGEPLSRALVEHLVVRHDQERDGASPRHHAASTVTRAMGAQSDRRPWS